jgi:hypothetical protein
VTDSPGIPKIVQPLLISQRVTRYSDVEEGEEKPSFTYNVTIDFTSKRDDFTFAFVAIKAEK